MLANDKVNRPSRSKNFPQQKKKSRNLRIIARGLGSHDLMSGKCPRWFDGVRVINKNNSRLRRASIYRRLGPSSLICSAWDEATAIVVLTMRS